ncbi:MAG: Wzz/FepE/Etk N-terminal domain-containing protein [Candidatus Aureabacteria bacterium]|nr:Wzz/FepE/Etk N-terminal domain-containing protein [Candidatus Auribacterota bacterium]
MAVNAAVISGAARSYVEVVFRRKWLFLVPVIIFTASAAGIAFILPPKYRSEAVLGLKEEQVENPHLKGVTVVTSVKDRLPMIRERLKSRSRLVSVIRSLGLDAQLRNDWGMDELVGSLRRSVGVELRPSGNVFSIWCEHYDRITCQRIVELLTDLFIKENLDLEKRETSIGIEFLESQRSIYRLKLEEAERNLTTFKEEHQKVLSLAAARELGDKLGVSDTTNINVLRYTNYDRDLIEMRLRFQELMARGEHLKSELKNTERYVISARVQEMNPIVRELKKTLAEKRIELHRLRLDATENHPLVQQIQRQIEKTQEELEKMTEETVKQETRTINPTYQELEKELGKTDAEIASVKKRIEITELFMGDYHKEIKQIPEAERKLTDLQRSYNIYNRRFLDLTERLETAKITERLETIEKGVRFEILEKPRVPIEPFKPNRKAIVLIGLVSGIFMGGGLVFIAEATDHSFSDTSQLRQTIDIPVLGSVSRILTVDEEEFNRSKKRLGLVKRRASRKRSRAVPMSLTPIPPMRGSTRASSSLPIPRRTWPSSTGPSAPISFP